MFCTNKFSAQTDNLPNVLPRSLLTGPAPGGYTLANDPPAKGASVWSSCVYSQKLDRIYVGTGNADPDHQLPNAPYSSGVPSLDAESGAFKGFFQPSLSDSYRPDDLDVLAIGSKNGSFFLLDPNSMQAIARRQLLPRRGGDGFPGDGSTPIPTVDPHATDDVGNENHSGTYSTAAVHSGQGRLFVGQGGWQDATHPSIDTPTTPFLRALDWASLQDVWPTTIGTDHIRRYNIPHQPMYANPGEVALSSPAVVNDVVFVTTNAAALYAFNVSNGSMLWQANDLGTPPRGSQALDFINIGPAVYGNAVVIGTGAGKLHIYSLS
jgi:outer membrane protein assembly factor BamB